IPELLDVFLGKLCYDLQATGDRDRYRMAQSLLHSKERPRTDLFGGSVILHFPARLPARRVGKWTTRKIRCLLVTINSATIVTLEPPNPFPLPTQSSPPTPPPHYTDHAHAHSYPQPDSPIPPH